MLRTSLLLFTCWATAATAIVAQTLGPSPATLTRPALVLEETIEHLPRGEQQDIRVLTAEFPPQGQTVFHTHRFPVTVYVLEGEFRLELQGQPSRIIRAGEAMVEPANVRMTGYNPSATGRLRVVIFYVSEPGTPFLDPVSASPDTHPPN